MADTFLYYLYSLAGTSIVLTLVTAATLLKECFGTRYKAIVLITVMLLISKIAEMVLCGSQHIIVKANKVHDENPDATWPPDGLQTALNFQLCSNAVYEIFTSLAYSVLAFYYFKMAKEMPDILAGIEVRETDTQVYRDVYFWVRFINVFFPVAENICAYVFLKGFNFGN